MIADQRISEENFDGRYAILDEKYALLKKIGTGATSKVFLAQEREGSELLAVKILKQQGGKTIENKAFVQEIEMLKKINHLNIINLKDGAKGVCKKTNGNVKTYDYVVLEYAENCELFDYMFFPKKGFGEYFGRYLFNSLISGLEECHNSGVAHRDLKTENIMMNRDWILKIADFGYATLIDGKRGDGVLGTFLGTLSYCAPEILSKKPYQGHEADLFSTGVILFVLVTGKLPFGKAILYDQYYRSFIKNDIPAFWKVILPKVGNVSEDFMDLVSKMLSYDPKDRPSFDSIREHSWMQGEAASYDEMVEEFQKRDSVVKIMKELEAQEEDKKKKSGSGGVYRGENEEEGSEINFETQRVLEDHLDSKNPFRVLCKAENADQVLGKIFNFFNEDSRSKAVNVSDKSYSIRVNYKASEEELQEIPEANSYTLGIEVSVKKYNDDFMIEFIKSQGDKLEFCEEFEAFSNAQAK